MSRARPRQSEIWDGQRPLPDVEARLGALLRLLRARALYLTVWIVACGALGFVYTRAIRPEFVASAQIILKPRQIVNDGPEDVRHIHQYMIDGEQCETELRVLRSERLLYQVFRQLDLAGAPEVMGGANGLAALASDLVGRLDIGSGDSLGGFQGYYAFADRVRSRRLGLSYVIEISYRAHSGEQAARVVNSIAAAYAAHRLRGVAARAKLQGAYLESRANALVAQIAAADAAVRSGVVPAGWLPDADVRILGAASRPLVRAYPRTGPFVAMTLGLATITGLLVILLFQNDRARPARKAPGGAEPPPATLSRRGFAKLQSEA